MIENDAALHHQLSLVGREVTANGMENVNGLPERQMMGLPPHYVASDLDHMGTQLLELKGASKQELLDLIYSEEVPFIRRFAAGCQLGYHGDLRISVYDPPMIDVPAARVTLGLDPDEVPRVVDDFKAYGVLADWIEKETPRHEVELEAYRIARYPITNQEYLRFMRETAHPEFPSSWTFGNYPDHCPNRPVYTISPESADQYASWLSQKTGRRFRLPTEAEWEYAAHPEGAEFPWGATFEPDCCNTVESGILQSVPIGIFPKGVSPCGCEDMAGNVEEYVADNYAPYPGARFIEDDLVATQGAYRVARGGSFTRFRDLARCKRRHGWYQSKVYIMGFRLAETPGAAS